MNNDAIKELKYIITLPDSPDDARLGRFNQWLQTWVTTLETSQNVIDAKLFLTEQMDTIKSAVVAKVVDDIVEQTEFRTSGKLIKAKVLILNRRPNL
jgi:hypothetical protein